MSGVDQKHFYREIKIGSLVGLKTAAKIHSVYVSGFRRTLHFVFAQLATIPLTL